MSTITSIHDDIDSWLAADLHDQLSADERQQLHAHLVDCAECRRAFEETKAMNNFLNNTLTPESADPGFEQRMVSRFRQEAPARAGLLHGLTWFTHLRGVQIAGACALLLALVQTGRWLTDPDLVYGGRDLAATATRPGSLADLRLQSARKEYRARKDESAPVSAGQFMDQPQPSRAAKAKASESGVSGRLAESDQVAAAAPAEAQPEFAEDAGSEQEPVPATMMAQAEPTTLPAPTPEANAATPDQPRKLIRNAQVQLEVLKYDEAVSRIANAAQEERGFIATSSSEKLANGKLQGTVVVKVVPENLDRLLQKIRTLGELKNQTLGTDDVTKAYFDTEARLRNAKRMEERLLDLLSKTGKVGDLLQVEKELARIRQEVEQMQGELKYWDALVSYATVTISLAEKDLDEPAEFLLKRTANLSLFSQDVEKTFADVKGVASEQVQVLSSNLDRDFSGQVTARISLLLAPAVADEVIFRIRGFGRVQSYNENVQRIPQGGGDENKADAQTKIEQDKVQLNVTVTRDEQEPPIQRTSLRLLTGEVTGKVAEIRQSVTQNSGEIRSSTFNREVDGSEFAHVVIRVPLKNYAALMTSLDKLGKLKDLRVQREDRPELPNPENAPAEITAQIYTQGDIVSDETGLLATIRRTLAQGFSALMWSLRMIGVALAFFAPWMAALIGLIWLVRFVRRRRAATRERS